MRALITFTIFLGFILFSTPAFAADVPTLDKDHFFVQDHADIISSTNKEDLLKIGQSLQDESTAQVVILTINSLDGSPANSFAVKAFDHYEIGEGDVNNGTLIMFAKADREIQIITGKGIEKIISDDRAGEILDEYAIPYFKEENYDEGLANTYKQVVADLADHYNVTVHADGDTSVAPEAAEQGIADKGMALIDKGKAYFSDHPMISIGAIIVVLFILKGFFGGGSRRRRRRYDDYDDGYGYSNRRNHSYNRSRSSTSRSSSTSNKRKSSGGGGSSSGGGSAGRKW